MVRSRNQVEINMAQPNMPKSADRKNNRPRKPATVQTATANRKSSKREQLRVKLEPRNGASLKEIEQAFDWQPHTVRAAISGLRKAGHEVQREAKEEGAVYRILLPQTA